ncbi:anti-sigma factor [Bordetella sp. N]|uniref:anti-sigma factor family protein n=1 Tax=Bordetella sp. N TaxID=1746199 RepID=UPI00070FC58C|nr:anti-sigma factor [Bordetella sp. N]ALM83923.1 anti-sigma factor [Bordetella sp. N]
MRNPPDDDLLHAYVDGQLDPEARKAVERDLARHPDRAALARLWMADVADLRAALADLPPPPASRALDPAVIRAEQAARNRVRMAIAASLVLCLGLGSLGGWQARGWQTQVAEMSARALPMSDAIAAYKLMVVDRSARIDFTASDVGALQTWLEQSVGPKAKLPDLGTAGFRPIGGRLFATEGGTAAMVLYTDADGRTLSFYVRPPESPQRLLPTGKRTDGGLLARYGTLHGLLYAVVGPEASVGASDVARVLDQQT